MSPLTKIMLRLRRQSGYTMAEILIVVVMIAIMASLAMPRLLNQSPKARAAEAVNVLGAIHRAEMQYADANDAFYGAEGTDVDLCTDANAGPVLGVDLTAACANWTFTTNFAGTVLTITATSVANAPDTLVLTSTNGVLAWSGTGIYTTGTGSSWPNLQ